MSSYVGSLDSSYIRLINNLMTIERQPLEQMETRRDSINVQRTAYTQSRTKLDALQKSLQALLSTDAFYDFKMGRSADVTATDPDSTVLTATPSSTAGVGKYNVDVTQLALADRDISAAQTGTDIPLGKSGNFWLGGTGTASVSMTPDSTVTASDTSEVLNNWSELGTSTYSVEVADFDGVMKFRLKDADGNQVGIKSRSSSDSLTTSWQEVTAGAYDTGRGLTVTFGDSPAAGSTSIDYTAAGTSVSILASDTLVNIASKINNADQSYGREIQATIVDKQLILTAANTGTNHTMIYNDGVGFGFANDQAARDATFVVNGVTVTRSSNENLTNVVNGVTLNLASDAEGNSAVVNVQSDEDPARKALEEFIKNFNEVQSFISEKTAVTRVTKDNRTTFTRGPLSGDYSFNDLRSRLFTPLISVSENDGSFKSLRDIGITIGDSMTASITDSDALSDALTRDFDSVAALLDSVMSELDTVVSRFTGSAKSGGYLVTSLDAFDRQIRDINNDIEKKNESLLEREQHYIRQFSEVQSQMAMLSYMQQQWSAMSGGTSRMY